MSPVEPSRNIGNQLLINILIFVVLFFGLSFFFHDRLELLAELIINKVGIIGLIAIILFVETFPTPIGPPVVMFIAIQGGYSPWMIGCITGLASVLGGHIGYWLGFRFGLPKKIYSLLQKRWPQLEDSISNKGPLGLALLSLAPIPLACLTWPSGALRMPYSGFSLAILMRIPKQLVYMLSIVGSIALAT